MYWFTNTFMASLINTYDRLGRPFKLSMKQANVCDRYMKLHRSADWDYYELDGYMMVHVSFMKKNSKLQNLNGYWFCKSEDLKKGLFDKL